MPVEFVPLETVAQPLVEALLDAAFGADRHTRTAYRIRSGALAVPGLNFAAVDGSGELLGSIQCWPVQLAGSEGRAALTMIGPIAVGPAQRNLGIGRGMLRHVLDACDASDMASLATQMLIGDPPYYAPFGFSAKGTEGWELPGPVERHRLLMRGKAVGLDRGRLEAAPPIGLPSGLRSTVRLA